MEGTPIDLFTYPFWIALTIAVIALRSTRSPKIRTPLFAIINLWFISLLLQLDFVYVGTALLLFWLFVRNIESQRLSIPVTAVLCLVILVFFIFHKLPIISMKSPLGKINPILATIGFSYIALRSLELIRGVYERRHPAPDLLLTINYLIPFHMLAAGPIQSYDEFINHVGPPDGLTVPKVILSIQRIVLGLFKKFVLAFMIDRIFMTGFHASGAYFFFEAQLFFLWVYLDFSAYSDIAVGTGQLIGIATPENFNKPYIARNMIDFWERWHISLSLFIRNNLFVPIQLRLMRYTNAKKPLASASIAFTLAFLLCGLWHDISLRFFLWGGMHAIGLVICNLYKHGLQKWLGRKGVKQYLQSVPIRIIAIFITYEFVAFSLVIVGYPF